MDHVTLVRPDGAEGERVIRWRLEALRRSGYDRRAALLIALRTDVDLHAASALVAS